MEEIRLAEMVAKLQQYRQSASIRGDGGSTSMVDATKCDEPALLTPPYDGDASTPLHPQDHAQQPIHGAAAEGQQQPQEYLVQPTRQVADGEYIDLSRDEDKQAGDDLSAPAPPPLPAMQPSWLSNQQREEQQTQQQAQPQLATSAVQYTPRYADYPVPQQDSASQPPAVSLSELLRQQQQREQCQPTGGNPCDDVRPEGAQQPDHLIELLQRYKQQQLALPTKSASNMPGEGSNAAMQVQQLLQRFEEQQPQVQPGQRAAPTQGSSLGQQIAESMRKQQQEEDKDVTQAIGQLSTDASIPQDQEAGHAIKVAQQMLQRLAGASEQEHELSALEQLQASQRQEASLAGNQDGGPADSEQHAWQQGHGSLQLGQQGRHVEPLHDMSPLSQHDLQQQWQQQRDDAWQAQLRSLWNSRQKEQRQQPPAEGQSAGQAYDQYLRRLPLSLSGNRGQQPQLYSTTVPTTGGDPWQTTRSDHVNGDYPSLFNPMLAARPADGPPANQVLGFPGSSSQRWQHTGSRQSGDGAFPEVAQRHRPGSFTNDLELLAPLLGTGAAAAAVAIQRGMSAAAGGLAGLGRRLPLSLGGIRAVTGSSSGASASPYGVTTGFSRGTTATVAVSTIGSTPAPTGDSRAALKAVLDGLQTAGTKDEMDAAEGALLIPLMRHQKLALAWMSKREGGCTQPIGGILADDQGLGKTVSTIALIVTNRPDAGRQGRKSALGPTDGGPGAKKRARSNSVPSIAGGGSSASLFIDDSESVRTVQTSSSSSSDDVAAVAETNNNGDGKGLEEEEDEVIELDVSDEGEAPKSRPSPSTTMAALQGGTLVVCPTTVLHQWACEIKTKTNPSAGITVHIYHGKGKICSAVSLAQYAVVLTTYATLAMEAPTKGAPQKKKKAPDAAKAAGSPGAVQGADTSRVEAGLGGLQEWGDDLIDLTEDTKPSQSSPPPAQQQQQQQQIKKRSRAANEGAGETGGPLYQIMWHRVVLDEAQCIKNRSTLAAHAAWSLKARRRWCLSGTPMQNSVDDLYSYFRFLKYEPYSRPAHFKEWIKDAISSNPSVGYKRLHAILQGVVLRRTKQTKIDGEPVVRLPERQQALEQRTFSPGELDFYQKLQADAADKMKRFQAEGTMRQNYVNILWMLLRLRQACNHPWLVKGSKHSYHHHAAPASAEVHAAQTLPQDLRERLASTLQDHLTECVVCGDVPEDPVVSLCNHVYCAQCVSSLISMAGHGVAEAELAYHCPACGHTLGKHDTFSAEAFTAAQPGLPSAKQTGADEAGSTQDGGTDGWQSSAKIDALMDLLRGLREKAGGESKEGGDSKRCVLTAARSVSHARLAAALKRSSPPVASSTSKSSERPAGMMDKVIVFSQWTAMLDLVEVPLKKERFSFRRLDGSMSVTQRQTAIQDFSHKPDIGVMLVSLKAASLGVNLVSANHVVLLDLWWNPTVEEQAIDRAHRIGQTKPVHVTRITVAGTVEDRIMQLQNKKRKMVAAAFGEEGGGGGLAANRLTIEDLHFLFQPSAAAAPHR